MREAGSLPVMGERMLRLAGIRANGRGDRGRIADAASGQVLEEGGPICQLDLEGIGRHTQTARQDGIGSRVVNERAIRAATVIREHRRRRQALSAGQAR